MTSSLETWTPPTEDRIRAHSSPEANRRIDDQTRGALDVAALSPEAAMMRLAELDREWDLDRAVMLSFGVLGALTARAAMRSLRARGRLGGWGLLFWAQVGFLVHHAVRGWCPPVPVLRRLGFRSSQEISAERCAIESSLAALDPVTDATVIVVEAE
ncbi:MAG TPA: hypothetical protein VHE35_33895 [Kofleriaceae bacterium]|nr:hypothetical protein [Kofleriaceae bacterium]